MGATVVVPETLELSLIIAEAVLRRLAVPEDVVEDAAELVRRYHTGETRLSWRRQPPLAWRARRPYLSLGFGGVAWMTRSRFRFDGTRGRGGSDGVERLRRHVHQRTARGRRCTWHGTTTAGNPAFPECQAFNFQLGQYRSAGVPVAGGQRPRLGRLRRRNATLGKWDETFSQWWLEGYVTSANFVQFESRRQQPIYFRAKPYAVWRGTIEDDRMTLVEFRLAL